LRQDTPNIDTLKREPCCVYVWSRNDYAQIAGDAEAHVTHPILAPVVSGKKIACVAGALLSSSFVTGVSTIGA
jgi:hypothetical protein